MNYFFGSINPNGDWNIFDFQVGDSDEFYGHSKMSKDDIIVLVVGKQNKNIESGAYAILKCLGNSFKVDKRYIVEAKCLLHSGAKPFLTRKALSEYVHLPIRVPVIIRDKEYEFSKLIDSLI